MFDTIVVGAGSAGAAVAARLSEDESRRVLLLEAGPDYRSADTPPGIQSIEPLQVMGDDTLTSVYTHAGVTATRSSVQLAAPYPRGRGVGGSSSINGMFAIRATVEDFDGWAAAGCEGWGYSDVLPLLKAMEADQDFPDAPYHGSEGPIPVLRPRREDYSPLEAAVEEAALTLGHPAAPDHNAPGTTGVSPYACNTYGSLRVSSNDGYLEPARKHSNLTILGEALVDRVIFEGSAAVGVVAVVDGALTEFRAHEVVISAGAVHSPAILLRSGLGPSAELRELGLDVVAELPVGRNLQDHPGIGLMLGINDLAEPGGRPGLNRGKICVRFTTGVGDEVNDGMIAAVGALGIGVPVSALFAFGNRVLSTGSVRLAGLDPLVEPVVNLNLLSEPDDMLRMRLIVDQLREFAAQPALRRAAQPQGIGNDGTDIDATMTGSEFSEFALSNVSDTMHASSSCRMGSPDDPRSVVDPTGRVLGVDGLRVADASIFPWVTRANPNLTAILVGEKIAAAMQ